MGQWLAWLPHSKKVLDLNSLADWRPSMWSSHVLSLLAEDLAVFLPQYKVMHVRLTVESKQAVDLSVNSCLSLRVSSATARQPVHGLPHLLPRDRKLQLPVTLNWFSRGNWKDKRSYVCYH